MKRRGGEPVRNRDASDVDERLTDDVIFRNWTMMSSDASTRTTMTASSTSSSRLLSDTADVVRELLSRAARGATDAQRAKAWIRALTEDTYASHVFTTMAYRYITTAPDPLDFKDLVAIAAEPDAWRPRVTRTLRRLIARATALPSGHALITFSRDVASLLREKHPGDEGVIQLYASLRESGLIVNNE